MPESASRPLQGAYGLLKAVNRLMSAQLFEKIVAPIRSAAWEIDSAALVEERPCRATCAPIAGLGVDT